MTTTIALRAPGQVTVKSVGLLADIGEHSAERDLKPNPSAMNNSGPTLTQDLVHSLIQDQSRIKPDAVAVQFGTEVSLTYRQLNQLSNGVARQLVCGRGTIVPIATSRSVGMIVSLLAVLKTGAAYTLLSSDTPVDRSKLIIKDVGAPFVIVDETTEGSFNDSGEIKIEDLMSRAGISPPTLKEDLNIYQIPSDLSSPYDSCCAILRISALRSEPYTVLFREEVLSALRARRNLLSNFEKQSSRWTFLPSR
jgi:non-ribosomal peptide synthetase component F